MSEMLLELTPEDIEKMSKTLVDALLDKITHVREAVVVDVEEVDLDAISSSVGGALDPLGQLQDWFISVFDTVSSWMVSTIETWITENVIPVIDGITNWITDNVIPVISGVVSDISDWITNNVLPAISGVVSDLSDWITDNVIPAISDVVTSVSDFITENVLPAISNAVTYISDYIAENAPAFIADAVTAVSNFITENVIPSISNAVTSISSFITDNVLPAISGAVTSISDFITNNVITAIGNVATTLSGFITENVLPAISAVTTALSETASNLLNSILDAMQGNFSSLISLITDSFTNVVSLVSTGFQSISTAFMGFTNAIMNLPTLLSPLFEPIVSNFSVVGNFFTAIYNTVVLIAQNPTGWIAENIIQPLISGLEWLWNGIQQVGATIWIWVQNAAKWFSGVVTDFFDKLYGFVISFPKALWEIASEKAEEITKFTMSLYKKGMETFSETVTSTFMPIISETLKSFKLGTPEEYKEMVATSEIQARMAKALAFAGATLLSPLWAQIPLRAVSWTLKGLARTIGNLDLRMEINLRPIGIGFSTVFNWAKAIAASFWQFAENMEEFGETLANGLVYGLAIWITQPLMKLLNYALADTIPIQLPPIDEVVEFIRRMMPHEEFDFMLAMSKYWLTMYGFSKLVLNMYLDPARLYTLKVYDRFKNERTVPLSLMYKLPSPSDVATMMVRDIFATPEDFFKLYKATGMVEDIGALYYFLRYRYPPPEKLWTFTMRGVSGLLWATLTDSELKEIAETDAKPLGAAEPISPVKLNFDAKTLFNAFKTYMKWHDYARFSWFKKAVHGFNFTSDNMVVVDTLADIPTKIDQRWMVRWGLYELLSGKGVTYKSPIQDFVAKVLEPSPASKEVSMDLTNFCRTLQATGLHPYWVPVTAVAEAINALTEERTLLRTGFINLFKEGFWGVDALEIFLAGFIRSSFKVAYFDIDKMGWSTGWINVPVMFLPPERKLLELRALMDRTLDVLRDVTRDVVKGYQEWIIGSYDEFKDKVTGVIDRVNEVFSKSYKEITGVELPDKLKLTYVEEYYKPYVESLSIWRDIYTIRRVRSWASRFLGWVMYRLAYGTVEKTDVDRFLTYVNEKAKLTSYEYDFLKGIMDILYGIASREYAPTPSQIATLAEYVVIPSEIISSVFDARRIPTEWRTIWAKYIDARPIADDVRGLLTSYRRALMYISIPKEIESKVIEYAKLIGFGDREMDILRLRVTLEELILQARENMREYIPTPLGLASICEYLPEARTFFDDVVKAKRVPSEWQTLWAKYIDIRPLVDDMKRYLSRAEQLYARFAIKTEDFKKVLDEVASTLGYTSKEIEFLMKVTEFERYRTAWTELMGTVDNLMSLAEYSPKAAEYALGRVNEMIDSLPISDAEKTKLKEMWKDYIKNKPVKSEAKMYVTQLINLYVDGLLPDADFKKELESMKEWGFSDNEIMFYEAIAALRKARKLRIPLTYGT